MASDHANTTLGSLVTLRRGTTYKGALVGYPGPALLGLSSIQRNGGFRRDTCQTYGGDSPANITLAPGDVYVSLKDVTQSGDLLGAASRVPGDVDSGRLTQDTVKLIPGSQECDLNYLYWVLRTPQYRQYCRSHAIGTTNLSISRTDFLNFPVPRETPIRRTLVCLLELLDDKIELIRCMNETLEGIARALFKSWFVDFDPVHAKAEGRQPVGMDAETAALFPDSFQESELGLIPAGWEVTTIGEFAYVIDCLHSKKPARQDAGELLLQLNNIRDDGLIDVTDAYFISQSDFQKWTSRMEASAGDCVITNVGRVGAVGQIPIGVRAALGRNMTGVRCKESTIFPTFLIEALMSDSMKYEIGIKTDSGTILESLNVRNIPRLRLVLPTRNVLQRFEDVARPIRKKMEHLLVESRALASIRDALLPKLISGELRVPEAEKLLQECPQECPV